MPAYALVRMYFNPHALGMMFKEAQKLMPAVAQILENIIKNSLTPAPTASPPGRPPHSKTGRLAANIIAYHYPRIIRISPKVDIPRAFTLEKGGTAEYIHPRTGKVVRRTYPPRPYARPVLDYVTYAFAKARMGKGEGLKTDFGPSYLYPIKAQAPIYGAPKPGDRTKFERMMHLKRSEYGVKTWPKKPLSKRLFKL